jgi:hypothetical protein
VVKVALLGTYVATQYGWRGLTPRPATLNEQLRYAVPFGLDGGLYLRKLQNWPALCALWVAAVVSGIMARIAVSGMGGTQSSGMAIVIGGIVLGPGYMVLLGILGYRWILHAWLGRRNWAMAK